MLVTSLEEQDQINSFVKGKQTREIAIIGLTMTNAHIKECAERWKRILKILKWIGSGMALMILMRIGDDLKTGFLHDFITRLTQNIFGG